MNEMNLRVLLAEGDPGEIASALHALYPEGHNGLKLTNVSSVSTLIATLEIVNTEVIFLDLALAHSDPLEAVRRVHRSAPAVPLIVLADASDKDCAARSLSQGALNYLIKGFIEPAQEGAATEGAAPKAPVPAHVEMRGSETILIAEDHESIREMARQILLSLGYRVLSACDGEEALKLCEKESPALAILDVVMPKLGGAAAASKLTALFAGLPILFTSGYSQDSENIAPATRYLQKPYSPTTLGRVVREILDQTKTLKASN